MRAIFRGAAKRVKREHNERVWLAWHIAALSKAEKMPRLKDMLIETPVKRQDTASRNLEVSVRSWLANRKR